MTNVKSNTYINEAIITSDLGNHTITWYNDTWVDADQILDQFDKVYESSKDSQPWMYDIASRLLNGKYFDFDISREASGSREYTGVVKFKRPGTNGNDTANTITNAWMRTNSGGKYEMLLLSKAKFTFGWRRSDRKAWCRTNNQSSIGDWDVNDSYFNDMRPSITLKVIKAYNPTTRQFCISQLTVGQAELGEDYNEITITPADFVRRPPEPPRFPVSGDFNGCIARLLWDGSPAHKHQRFRDQYTISYGSRSGIITMEGTILSSDTWDGNGYSQNYIVNDLTISWENVDIPNPSQFYKTTCGIVLHLTPRRVNWIFASHTYLTARATTFAGDQYRNMSTSSKWYITGGLGQAEGNISFPNAFKAVINGQVIGSYPITYSAGMACFSLPDVSTVDVEFNKYPQNLFYKRMVA